MKWQWPPGGQQALPVTTGHTSIPCQSRRVWAEHRPRKLHHRKPRGTLLGTAVRRVLGSASPGSGDAFLAAASACWVDMLPPSWEHRCEPGIPDQCIPHQRLAFLPAQGRMLTGTETEQPHGKPAQERLLGKVGRRTPEQRETPEPPALGSCLSQPESTHPSRQLAARPPRNNMYVHTPRRAYTTHVYKHTCTQVKHYANTHAYNCTHTT